MDYHGIGEEVVQWRKELHQFPEIGLDLPQTSAYVKKHLDEMGIPYKEIVGGNAIVGLIEGEAGGKCIGLRADMDGLPIQEETGLEYASKNGNMHACGHDGHTAMLLGAAKYLNMHKDQLNGTVKLLFQPAEESPGGAKPMLDEGAFENPKVDVVFGMHAGRLWEEQREGTIAFKSGAMMAAPDILNIYLRGKGTHGAYPENGQDMILIASELVMNLQSLISREKAATEPAVLSICQFHSGDAHNILPSEVYLQGTVRTYSEDLRVFIKKRIAERCEAFAKMHGVEIEVDHQFTYPALINDVEFTEFAMQCGKEIFGEENTIVMPTPSMGGEDMAYFLKAAPGTFAFLSNPNKVDGAYYPHHNPKFDIDNEHLEKGSMLLAKVAMEYLK